MCEIIVKCTKCDKFVASVTNKIRRLKKSIRKTENEALKTKLSCEIDGLEFGLKMIKKYCQCDIRSWHERNGYE